MSRGTTPRDGAGAGRAGLVVSATTGGLTVRPGTDVFYLPGGKPRAGESDVAALRREVREEVGVESIGHVHPGRGDHAPAHDALGGRRPAGAGCGSTERPAGAASPAAEVDELAWLSTGDRARLAPAARLLFDRLVIEGRLAGR